MKKLFIILMAFVMLSGCVGLEKAKDFICNPTPEQQQTAAQMLAALDAAQAIGSAFYPIIGIFKASAVLTNIKNGGCFLIAELTEAFKAVDAANASLAQTRYKMLKGSVDLKIPEYSALRKYLK